MSKPFKPMLAVNAELDQVKWPVLISPKFDGVRAIVRGGVVLSRSLKPIPCPTVQSMFSHLEGADGELIFGRATAKDVYNATVSAVMSGHECDGSRLSFVIFDLVADGSYAERLERAQVFDKEPGAVAVAPTICNGQEDALERMQRYLKLGYEGAMLRSPAGAYKFGRSTVKEGGLLKMKLFEDAEATIVGYKELMHNENGHIETTAEAEAAGLVKRSTRREGLVPGGVLGTLLCVTSAGVEFGIGSGFTAKQRADLWADRDNLVGRLVKYRYQPAGEVAAPRFPTFIGFRSELDL